MQASSRLQAEERILLLVGSNKTAGLEKRALLGLIIVLVLLMHPER